MTAARSNEIAVNTGWLRRARSDVRRRQFEKRELNRNRQSLLWLIALAATLLAAYRCHAQTNGAGPQPPVISGPRPDGPAPDIRRVESRTTNGVAAPKGPITFKTAEPAPEGFDAWDLLWRGPRRDPETPLEAVVLQADGKEYARQEFSAYPGPSDQIQSSFSPGFAGGDPKALYNQPIRIRFSVSRGPLTFVPADVKSFQFRFFKKDANGDVDWRKPFKTIEAVMEPMIAPLPAGPTNQLNSAGPPPK